MIGIILIIVVLAMGGGVFFFAARLVYMNYFKNKFNMETTAKKFMQSLTFKGFTIGLLTLILLIPGAMIQNLIRERQERSRETIQQINNKWSHSQTLCAPLLLIPYTTTKLDKDQKIYYEEHTLYITPKDLKINVSITPEERYYGI